MYVLEGHVKGLDLSENAMDEERNDKVTKI